MSAEAFVNAEEAINGVYEQNEGSQVAELFFERHGVDSMAILTVYDYYGAVMECEKLRERITGKTVIEIGAGVGMLAIEMANYAKRVYAIEADPAWSWVFTQHLYAIKKPNLTWIFGTAESVADSLRGDVAVVYTRSNIEGMTAVARRMAPQVILGPLCTLEEKSLPEDAELVKQAKAASENMEVVSRHGASAEFIRQAVRNL